MSHVVCTLFDLGERYFNPIPQVPGGLSPFRFGAAADGMALCEDVNGYLPARHPYRLAWNDFLRAWIATDWGGTREMAISEANCVIVPPSPREDELANAVHTMADRIRQGVTSRVEQRRVYDRVFSPPVVAPSWCNYLEARQLASA